MVFEGEVGGGALALDVCVQIAGQEACGIGTVDQKFGFRTHVVAG